MLEGINMAIVWLIALVVFLAIEVTTLGLTTIWFAGGALLATIIAAVGGPLWLQIVVFIVVSLLLLIFTRPIAMKYFNKDREKTNIDSIVGKQAIVVSEISNLNGVGKVTVDGNEWSACAESDEVKYEKDDIVIVKAVKGVKLIVSK